MLAVAWGSVIYSLFIVSMHVLTTMSYEEQAVYREVTVREETRALKAADATVFNFLVFARRLKVKRGLMAKKLTIRYKLHFTEAQKKRLDRQLMEAKCHVFYCDLLFSAMLFSSQRKAM